MTEPVLIRPATAADLDDIVELHTRARSTYYTAGGLAAGDVADPAQRRERLDGWARALHSPDRSVRCATRGDRVVGILSMGRPAPEQDTGAVGQLYQIHVDPDSWGLGIGGRLHGVFVEQLTASSLTTGLLEVWERNTRARDFYHRRGWRPDGDRRTGPGGADYVFLRLTVG